jgi:hypothetical protein
MLIQTVKRLGILFNEQPGNEIANTFIQRNRKLLLQAVAKSL